MMVVPGSYVPNIEPHLRKLSAWMRRTLDGGLQRQGPARTFHKCSRSRAISGVQGSSSDGSLNDQFYPTWHDFSRKQSSSPY